MLKKCNLKLSLLVLLCSAYSTVSYSAPVAKVLNSTVLAGSPSGSEITFPETQLSEDGRFLLLTASIGLPFSSATIVNKLYDLYTGKSINVADFYSTSNRMKALSASGRYVLTGYNSSFETSIVDFKVGSVATGFPKNSTTLSDNGRYIGYTEMPAGFALHGYVRDITAGTNTLATPQYGTTNQLVTGTGVPSDILLSGDGKVFFWGIDGTNTGFTSIKPNSRDLIAHKWGVGSTVNPRVSNCNNCADTVTNKGSFAYQYSVSADGNVAAFKGYADYGYTTSTGDISNGKDQIYTRDLTTLKVDLISADDSGFIEPDSVAVNYENPSISSDGRFVVFNGGGKTYIRDRFAKKKQVLDAASSRATISGNGKSILLQKADGWYTLANPYLVTTTDFTSNYLFGNILLTGSTWNNFDHFLLTDNNTWTGYIDYSGSGSNTVKFNFAGQWSGSNYVPGSLPGTDFGDNNSDGTAALGEAAISLTQGAGRYKVTFNDQTNQYTIKKLINVNFNCYNGYTTLGQSVYITGNIPELGNWSPANAVKLSPTSYPTWTGSLALPSNTAVEWKCIKRDELDPATSLVWESGSNNQFNPSSSQTTDGHF